MTRIIEERAELQRNINEMKSGSYEEMLLIVLYCLKAYFKSLMAFGKDSRVTKDNINIIREMFIILKTERTLLNYILRNIDSIDVFAAEEVVKMLDDVNDDTIKYYYNIISDIEEASELGQEFRGYRPRREYPTLIKDDSYMAEVFALRSNLDNIKSYLGYDDEFWEYIKRRTKTIDTSSDITSKISRVTPISDEGIIVDMEVLTPKINNLESSLTAIRVFAKAHSIYEQIGSPIEDLKDLDYRELEEGYVKTHLPEKAKQYLKLKDVN